MYLRNSTYSIPPEVFMLILDFLKFKKIIHTAYKAHVVKKPDTSCKLLCLIHSRGWMVEYRIWWDLV